ncbi:MAG: sulfite exporter TauE/SafE family protein [Candidatus Kariarchaeaceae archaeon]|jgi:uncharacterized membrane protein YfcA
MLPDIWFIFIGLVVGSLVGLTGLGGGTLMTPLLILSGLPTVIAIGTDLVYAAVTKTFASILHIRDKNVDFKIVAILLSGSVPGLFVGLYFSNVIIDTFGQEGLNAFLTIILSILLISLSIVSIVNEVVKVISRIIIDAPDEVFEEFETVDKQPGIMSIEDLLISRQTYSMILGAFVVGMLVQLTSVGSGVLITILLLNILPARRVVGTELVHASILVAISSIIYSSSGLVDFGVLWKIVLGALGGILIGIRYSKRIPKERFKIILLVVILLAGFIVLYEASVSA